MFKLDRELSRPLGTFSVKRLSCKWIFCLFYHGNFILVTYNCTSPEWCLPSCLPVYVFCLSVLFVDTCRSLSPLLDNPKMERDLRNLVRSTLAEFCDSGNHTKAFNNEHCLSLTWHHLCGIKKENLRNYVHCFFFISIQHMAVVVFFYSFDPLV